MPSQRVRGQEATILIVRDGALEAELTDISNFNAELMLEVLQKGYLGEVEDRFDEIFHGAKLDFEMDSHSQDWITFALAVADRAQRRTPDTVINISAVLAYPNGQTPTVLFPDVKFGPMPFNMGARVEYLKIKIEGSCGKPEFTLT